MAKPYTFARLLIDSVWFAPGAAKLVWVAIVGMMDEDGLVEAYAGAVARRAGVSEAECEAALEWLASPDPYSQFKNHEGRRIESVDRGWRVLEPELFKQGEIPQNGYGQSWARQRRLALKRDGGACVYCLERDRVTVHHIATLKSFSGNTEAANQLSNLITLCGDCHHGEHRFLRMERRSHGARAAN